MLGSRDEAANLAVFGWNYSPLCAGGAGEDADTHETLPPLQALCIFSKPCKVDAVPLFSELGALGDS